MVAFLAAGQLPGLSVPEPKPPASHDLLAHHYHFKVSDDAVRGTLTAYHDAVQLYRRGDTEHAMVAVRQLPAAQLEFVIQVLRDRGRITQTNPEHTEYLPFIWSREDLAAAGLLQGELAIAALGTAPFEEQLRLALSGLASADEPRPNTTDREGTWTRDWLRAMGNLLLDTGDWGDEATLVEYADILFPDDGPLVLVRGTMADLLSGAMAPPSALTSSEGFARMKQERDKVRREALDALTHAVRLLPGSSEAAVRLAHVLVEARQDVRAEPLLDHVLASDVNQWWMLAALLRGRVYEEAQQPAEAEKLYGLAIDRFPKAQSPYLALAMLQAAAGNAEASVATLDRMYRRPAASDGDDPWWQYRFSMEAEGAPALDRLRAAVRQ